MVAGLPGTGIGGFFFLLSALLMPVVELGRTIRGKSGWNRWLFVLTYSGLALATVGAIWATGELVGRVLHSLAPAAASGGHGRNFIQQAPIVLTLTTLLSVLLGVKVIQKTCGTGSRGS